MAWTWLEGTFSDISERLIINIFKILKNLFTVLQVKDINEKFGMTCKRAVKKYSNDYLFNEHITIATCTLLCCNLSLKKKGAYHQRKKKLSCHSPQLSIVILLPFQPTIRLVIKGMNREENLDFKISFVHVCT